MRDSTDSISASPSDQTVNLSRQAVDRLLDDQRQRSQRGLPFRVETYLEAQPGLKSNSEAILDLIYNEMLLREAGGEKPQLQEYVGRFPHLAQQLADQFEIEQALQDQSHDTEYASESDAAGVLTQDDVGTTSASALPERTLLDFDLREMLGRGGKGVVYKAIQKSLNRTVALKMIRSGEDASPEDRARFTLEAEAVARLQHPNLVHIYEVGEWQGQPYLALEYVSGGNLAQRLEGAPWPAQDAARLIKTLAHAMHHAHQKGIVHRDLKPANVLLETLDVPSAGAETIDAAKTTAGHWSRDAVPKITDFGLAKFVAGDTLGLTETGSFLGTPCYTAPEQAAGKIQEIGPVTDVYALGAILYELITGRPPFQGPTVMLILEQVRSLEPIAPRSFAPTLPRDLETICMKCLEKDPRRRYASALVLAEDLQRFQAGQPIQARPVGRVERTRKWIKRRPALAALIGVITVGTLTLLVGGWWTALSLAKAWQKAEANYVQAEENFKQALDAVEYLLDEVGAVDLADVPQLEPVRKKLLLQAKSFYDDFLDKRGDDPKIRLIAGRGFSRLGAIHELLDEHAAAEKAYRRAIALLDEANAPADQRRELGRTMNQLGGLLKKLGQHAQAEDAVRKGLEVRKRLAKDAADDPAHLQDLATSYHDLGTVLARVAKERAAARSAYQEALDIQEKLTAASPRPEYQRDRARTLNNLGLLLQYTDPTIARKTLAQAVALNQQLVAKHPTVPAYRRDLARTCNNLAGILGGPGARDDAEKMYDQALALLTQLSHDFPTVPSYRQDLAGVYLNLGLFHESAGRLTEADKAFDESLRVRRELAGESPEVPEYQQRLANTLVTKGSLLEKKNQVHAAEEHYEQAVFLLEWIAIPGARPIYHSDLGQALHRHALLRRRRGVLIELTQKRGVIAQSAGGPPWSAFAAMLASQQEQDGALALYGRAILCQRVARAADPLNTYFRDCLYDHYFNLVSLALQRSRYDLVAEPALGLTQLHPKSHAEFLRAAQCLALCIPLASQDRNLTEQQKREQVESYAQQSVECLRRAVSLGFNDVAELERVSAYAPLRDRPDFQKLLEFMKKNPVEVG